MSGIPPIKPGKVEVDDDMSASAAARAAPTTRASQTGDTVPAHQDLAGRDTFALSSFLDGLIKDYVTKNPDQADQIRAINAPTSKTPDSDGKTEFTYALPKDVRKLMALHLIPLEFKVQYVMNNIRGDSQLIALRETGLNFKTEMAAVQSLYDNCSTQAMYDAATRWFDNPTTSHLLYTYEAVFPTGYTKEGIWNDLFGPADKEAAIVKIYDRFGCLPSAIPDNRQSFMMDRFIYACKQVDEMIEHGDDAPTNFGYSMSSLRILPPKIGQLINLEEFGIAAETITHLPPEIGQLKNLKTLRIMSTPLSSLPPEIGQLKQLQKLDISYTNVASLPPEMAQLENLQTVNLSGTPFDVLPTVDEPVYTYAEYLLSPFMASYTEAVAAKEQAVADEKAANMAAREAKVKEFLPAGCRVIFSNNY